VVHVGLFQLLLSLKAIISSRLANSSIFQNNKLLIAIRLHMDVMVVGNNTLSHILNQSLKNLKKITFILLKMEYVKIQNTLDKLQFPASIQFKLTPLLNLKPPSLLVLLPLQLKLINSSSKDTQEESSTVLTVELTLITLLPQLVMALKVAKTTTLSETHGVPTGVSKDTLELQLLLETVSVVSKCNPSGLLQTESSNEKIYKLYTCKE